MIDCITLFGAVLLMVIGAVCLGIAALMVRDACRAIRHGWRDGKQLSRTLDEMKNDPLAHHHFW